MTEQRKPQDILILVGMVEAATKDLLSAEQAENEARKVSTAARNRLNDAQKKLDDALLALRSSAPLGTAWHRSTHDPVVGFLRARHP